MPNHDRMTFVSSEYKDIGSFPLPCVNQFDSHCEGSPKSGSNTQVSRAASEYEVLCQLDSAIAVDYRTP